MIDWSTLPVAVSPESRRPDACATSTPAIPANASTAATTSNPRLGRRRAGRRGGLGAQGGGGPGGVVVPQREVVGVVEVAGFVLVLEVLEGAQQEVALGRPGRSSVNHLDRAAPGPRGPGRRRWVTTGAFVASGPARPDTPARATTRTTTGRIQTRPANPDAGGTSCTRSPKLAAMAARISLGGLTLLHQPGDLDADRPRRRDVGVGDGLAVAHRALERARDRLHLLLGGARRAVVERRATEGHDRQRGDDDPAGAAEPRRCATRSRPRPLLVGGDELLELGSGHGAGVALDHRAVR